MAGRKRCCPKQLESRKREPEPATSAPSAENPFPAARTPLRAEPMQIQKPEPTLACLLSFPNSLPITNGHFPSRFASDATHHFGESRNDARVLTRRRRTARCDLLLRNLAENKQLLKHLADSQVKRGSASPHAPRLVRCVSGRGKMPPRGTKVE
jgi:hypothetical protein